MPNAQRSSSSHAAPSAEHADVYIAAPAVYLSRRLAAMVYEWLIVTAIVIMAGLVLSVLIGQFAVYEQVPLPMSSQPQASIDGLQALETESKETAMSQTVRGVLVTLGVMAAVAAWFIWCWVKTGQTLPMKVWSLRVQYADGTKITAVTAALRLVAASFSLAMFGCGFFWSWLDPQRRTLHDIICKTQVVRIPKNIRSV